MTDDLLLFFFSTASEPERRVPENLDIRSNSTQEMFARQAFFAAEAP